MFLLVMVQTGVATAALRGMGRPWLEASYHLVGMTLHAALSLVLVRRFGLDGALIALVVSGAVSALVLLVVFLRATGFTTGGVLAAYVRPTLFTAIAAALALAWCGAPGAASALGRAAALVVLARLALVFAAVVGVGYVTTGVVRASELRSLRAALRPAGAPNAPR
jgi:peptidoglycan biosynthesis protein MviN/MurJ (putative lipid II flippase)